MGIEIRKPTFLSLNNKKFDIKKKRKLLYKKKKIEIFLCNFLDNKSRFYIFKNEYKKIFIKKIKKDDLKIKEEQQISIYLKNKKVNVPKVRSNTYFLSFFKKYLKKNESIVCYDLIEPVSTLENKDFFDLGKSLYSFHKSLNKYPRKNIVKRNTFARIKMLKDTLTKFISKSHRKSNQLNKIKKILIKEKNIFDQINKKDLNFLTHGDLVPSNIIKSKKKIFFIDFEDSSYSYFFKELDISIIIERLILFQKKLSNNKKKKLISLFISGYKNENYNKLVFNKSLYFALIFNNIKSMLTLLNSYDVKKKFISYELNKFIYLYKLANQNKKLIKSFEKN